MSEVESRVEDGIESAVRQRVIEDKLRLLLAELNFVKIAVQDTRRVSELNNGTLATIEDSVESLEERLAGSNIELGARVDSLASHISNVTASINVQSAEASAIVGELQKKEDMRGKRMDSFWAFVGSTLRGEGTIGKAVAIIITSFALFCAARFGIPWEKIGGGGRVEVIEITRPEVVKESGETREEGIQSPAP